MEKNIEKLNKKLKAEVEKKMEPQNAIVILENNLLNQNQIIIKLNAQDALNNNKLKESQDNYKKLLEESTKELNNFVEKSNKEKKYFNEIINSFQQKKNSSYNKIKNYENEINKIKNENISLKNKNLNLVYNNNSINKGIKNIYDFLDKMKNKNENISKAIKDGNINYNINLFYLEINRIIISLVNLMNFQVIIKLIFIGRYIAIILLP